MWRRLFSLLRYRGILICNIAPSLRLLVPSSPQVRRQSAHMSHYHLRSKVTLDLVDHVVDPGDVLVTFLVLFRRYGRTRSPSVTPVESIRRFWRAFTRSYQFQHLYPLPTHELGTTLLHVLTYSTGNFLPRLAILSLTVSCQNGCVDTVLKFTSFVDLPS
jgi:hypothetical protein